jgi:hypothetical protein
MEKLNKVLAILTKYQFWVTFVIMVLVAIGCWWMATSGLAKQFSDRKTKLEGGFRSIVIPQNQPNSGVIDKIRQQQEALKRSVFEAWTILYNQQKSQNPLPKVLGEDFELQFENLKPKQELAHTYLEMYQNFIKLHLPTLKLLVDARRPSERKEGSNEAGAGGAGFERRPTRALGTGGVGLGSRAAGAEEELIGTVEWKESDYLALEERFTWKEAPSTLAVVLAQENLWVYEALLRVIKNTNEGATGYTTAAVKRIDALEIGDAAAKAWRDAQASIFKTGTGTGGEGRGMGRVASLGGRGDMRDGRGGDQEKQQILIEGRYVDDKGQPLSYEPESPYYAKHPNDQFKMMPIRMMLLMDQRRLPKLLVACANSSMPIEVKRVRILKSQGGTIELGGMTASPGGAASGGRTAMGMGSQAGSQADFYRRSNQGRPDRGRGAGGEQDFSENLEAGPLDVPVEIHGVIYIYNSPERDTLSTSAAAAEQPTDAAGSSGAMPAAPSGGVPGGAPPAYAGEPRL